MNNKTWIVAKREYLTRVQKKSFILVTLLTPLGIALFTLLLGWIMSEGGKSDQRVLILDETGIVQQMSEPDEVSPYDFSNKDLNVLKNEYTGMGYDILVHIPEIRDSAFSRLDVEYYGNEKTVTHPA